MFFKVPLENIPLIWRRHPHRWRAAKFWPFLELGTYGFWGGRDLYRATPSVTRGLRVLRREGSLSCYTFRDTGPQICGLTRRTATTWSPCKASTEYSRPYARYIVFCAVFYFKIKLHVCLERENNHYNHNWSRTKRKIKFPQFTFCLQYFSFQ